MHETITEWTKPLRLAGSFGNQKATRLQTFVCPPQDGWKIVKKMEEIVGKKDVVGSAHCLCRCSVNKEIDVVYPLFRGLCLADPYHLGGQIGGRDVGNRRCEQEGGGSRPGADFKNLVLRLQIGARAL